MSKSVPHPASEDFAGDTLLRLPQILGDAERGIPAIVPLSRTTFLKLVQDGLAPQPIRFGQRNTCWRLSAIKVWMETLPTGGNVPLVYKPRATQKAA